MLMRLMGGFFGKLTSGKWAKIEKSSSDSALRDINGLLERGILEKEAGSSRSISYALVIPKRRNPYALSRSFVTIKVSAIVYG